MVGLKGVIGLQRCPPPLETFYIHATPKPACELSPGLPGQLNQLGMDGVLEAVGPTGRSSPLGFNAVRAKRRENSWVEKPTDARRQAMHVVSRAPFGPPAYHLIGEKRGFFLL